MRAKELLIEAIEEANRKIGVVYNFDIYTCMITHPQENDKTAYRISLVCDNHYIYIDFRVCDREGYHTNLGLGNTYYVKSIDTNNLRKLHRLVGE